MDAIQALADRLSDFVAARDWAQFHTPKNLAMALAGEAGELIAEFQWLTPEEIYLVRLASVLDVDLIAAAHAKIDQNEVRYPPDAYRGSARKAPPTTEMAADRGH